MQLVECAHDLFSWMKGDYLFGIGGRRVTTYS